jgi:hypothetical protein
MLCQEGFGTEMTHKKKTKLNVEAIHVFFLIRESATWKPCIHVQFSVVDVRGCDGLGLGCGSTLHIPT